MRQEQKDQLKSLATLIGSIAALVTAVASYQKAHAEPHSKASYDTLASAVEEVSKGTQRNHDDIVALKAYMEARLDAEEDEPAASAAPSSSPEPHPEKKARPSGVSSSTTPAPPTMNPKPVAIDRSLLDRKLQSAF